MNGQRAAFQQLPGIARLHRPSLLQRRPVQSEASQGDHGIDSFAETCPQYLLLDEKRCKEPGKVKRPATHGLWHLRVAMVMDFCSMSEYHFVKIDKILGIDEIIAKTGNPSGFKFLSDHSPRLSFGMVGHTCKNNRRSSRADGI